MISKDKKFTEEEMNHRKELLHFYRTEQGTKELARRLVDLCFFRQIKPEEVGIRNYGILVLEELGVLDQDKIEDVVSALLGLIPFKNEEGKKQEKNEYIGI